LTPESAPPLEAPLLEELPLEELLPGDPLLEEPLLLEELLLVVLPLEEPPLDIAPPESSPPPAAPSLDTTGFEVPGELEQARTGAVTSAQPQRRTDRAFMLGGKAIPVPCARNAGSARTTGGNAVLVGHCCTTWPGAASARS
jgi:hypothetical protein